MGGPGPCCAQGSRSPRLCRPSPLVHMVIPQCYPCRAPGSSGCRRPLRPSVLLHLHTVVSLFQRPVFMPATLSALARLMSYLLPLRPPLWLPTFRG